MCVCVTNDNRKVNTIKECTSYCCNYLVLVAADYVLIVVVVVAVVE